jgi:phage terminase large subunit GpA-like protein
LSNAFEIIKDVAREHLKPRVVMDLCEYANNFRYLAQGNAEPGRYRTSRTRYIEEVLRTISRHDVHSVTLMFSSQTAKSETLLSVLQYYADYEPCPMMIIQPTLDAASAFSKERISKQIECTPALRRIFGVDQYKNKQNTINYKEFPGGFWSLQGSNSPSGLASKPIRVVVGDEIDRWAVNAKGEGSPVEIASRRTLTYHNYKHIWVSTPVVKGKSKIEELFLAGTQHVFEFQCVHCDEHFYPELSHLKWVDNDPDTAMLSCPHCGSGMNDVERWRAANKGKWVPRNPTARDYSYHTNAFSSPFVSLAFIANEYIKCENLPSKLGPFYNTILGQPYEEVGETLADTNELIERREDYSINSIPNDVILLTFGADVQGDRIEAQVLGHTENDSIYVVHTLIFPGDTSEIEVYDEFVNQLYSKTAYFRQDGIQLFIKSGLIDSGYNTKIVYAAANRHKKLNIFASKGKEGLRASLTLSKNLHKQQFYVVGVDIYKEFIFNSLAIKDTSKSGYIHFSIDQNDEYFQQLTQSESRIITTDKRGRSYAHFEKRKGSGIANEMLDTFVYGLAAKDLLRNVDKKNAAYNIKKQLLGEKEPINIEKEVKSEPIQNPINSVSAVIPKPSKYANWGNLKTN